MRRWLEILGWAVSVLLAAGVISAIFYIAYVS